MMEKCENTSYIMLLLYPASDPFMCVKSRKDRCLQ